MEDVCGTFRMFDGGSETVDEERLVSIVSALDDGLDPEQVRALVVLSGAVCEGGAVDYAAFFSFIEKEAAQASIENGTTPDVVGAGADGGGNVQAASLLTAGAAAVAALDRVGARTAGESIAGGVATLGHGERWRDLSSLPKAHLHVHFPHAMARHDTILDWASAFDSARAEAAAAKEAADARAKGNEAKALKYKRRAALLSNPITAFGRVSRRGASEEELLADIRALDEEEQQPGASGIWDMQWISNQLSADDPEGKSARVLREIYLDALEEGIVWTEVCSGCKIEDGEVSPEDSQKWCALIPIWRELEAEFSGRTAVRFIVDCPKIAADVPVLKDFFARLSGSGALPVVGVGQWGIERSANEFADVYALCIAAGFSPVCVHAGENALQAGQPSGAEVDEGVLASYDGAQNVRDAVACGARRIGHGIEAAKEAVTMAELGQEGVCLEVCLLSNRRLGYCKEGLEAHPLPRLMACGVDCCLAADDPAFFGAASSHGLLREFIVARHILGFDDARLADLARNSLEYARAPVDVRRSALASLDSWLAGAQAPG